MQEATRKALELFAEKARELRSFRFVKFIEEQEMRIEISGNTRDGATRVDTRQLPDYEDVRAFISALRLFLQKGDPISFRYLANTVYTDSRVSENWKRNFDAARMILNQFLDEVPEHLIVVDGDTKTRREIKDVFISGDLAHLDKKLRPAFEAWKSDQFVFPLRQMDFYETLGHIYNCIKHVLYWTEQELGSTNQGTQPSADGLRSGIDENSQ